MTQYTHTQLQAQYAFSYRIGSLVLVEEVEELLLVLPHGQLDALPEELEVARREGERRVRVHLHAGRQHLEEYNRNNA